MYKGAELSTLLSIKKKDAEGEQVKYNQLIARVRNLHEGFTEATEGRLKVECPKIDWLGSRTGEV